MEKIRVAYLMHGIGFGGAYNSLYLLLKSLDKSYFEFFIYTINSNIPVLKEKLKAIADKFCIFPFPTISFHQYGVSSYTFS